MAQRQRLHLTGIIHREDIPLPVAEIVFGQAAEGLSRQIGAEGIRDDEDLATSVDDAFTQLNVLVTHQTHIVQAIFLKHPLRPAAERHRIHFFHPFNTSAESRVAHAKLVAQHLSDGQGLGSLVKHIGLAHATHIFCIQFLQPLDDGRAVVGFIESMGIDAHDDIALGLTDAFVHGVGHNLVRIVENPQVRALRQIRSNDFPSAVGAHAVHEEDFQIVFGIVLGHDGLNATGDVFLLVVYRANNS